MSVRVGVIGVGMIGQDHIRRLTTVLAGASVTAVTDADAGRAGEVAEKAGARALATGQDVIADPEVDAVLVASWGATHEEYVLAAIAAGKPVFCEKPLAETQEACLRIIEAEVAHGSRLVQVGYMRRYDAQYRALKQVIASGAIGTPLLMHAGHRNPSVPGFYTREHAIVDTAVHDIDVARWVFDEEIAAASVLVPRKSRHGGDLQDPLLVVLETEGGALVDIEISVNIRYGYDIRGEVVGEDGTVALADSGPVLVRHAATVASPVPADWRERFLRAYDTELQEWVDGVAAGLPASGPSAWDGYAVTATADAALEALNGGSRTTVKLAAKPGLYG